MNRVYEHESDELDVFEATQYFYGEIDEMTGGLIGLHGLSLAAEEREESSGVQQGELELDDDEGQVIGSSRKQPRSPGAKLVSYLNHFFHRVGSSRKLKCLNPSSSTREEEAEEEDKGMQKSLAAQSERGRSRNNTIRSRRSNSSVGSKPSNSESDLETWGSRLGGARIENIGGGFEESRWVLKPGSHNLPFSRATKEFTHFGRVRREEINGEDDDDDLFELKNIYAQQDLSDGLPVFATTNIEVTKRKTTMSSTS